jgi:hypothetical protein
VASPPPDLGGASPIWGLIVLAIVMGPFVWAIVYGIRHRNSGAPKDESVLEAQAMTQIMKDMNDMRTWRGSRR